MIARTPELWEPLAPGESYLHLFLDADEAAVVMTGAQIRVYALQESLRRAAAQGLEVTRGPEIVELHRPEYPGDQTWVSTVSVGRRSSS